MVCRTALFLQFILLTWATDVLAQEASFAGRVLNARNEPLSGATVRLDDKQAIADVEGRFYIQLHTNKKYNLTVSNTGYGTRLITEIEVTAGRENFLEIILEESKSSSLEAVVVRTTSRRQENTNTLLAFQKNNPSLSSGIAADFIRQTPDKNTGEVLKRISGASIQEGKFVVVRGLSDRYNSALINNAQLPSTEPDKKAFSFDVIPASLIDNIVINKTATPELPGEFAGGLVQIHTKDVPGRNLLSIGVSFGFNTGSVFGDFESNKRGSADWLGFDNGGRSIPGGFPGSAQRYRSGSPEEQLEWSRMFNGKVYATRITIALPAQSHSITWGHSVSFRDGGVLGTIISLRYRNSMLSYDVRRSLHQQDGEEVVSLKDRQNKYNVNLGGIANFTYVKGKHKISFKNLFNQLLDDNYYSRTGKNNDRVQDVYFLSSVLNQRSLYSGQLEGEHQLTQNGARLRWNGNFSYNWKSQPDLRTQSYNRPQGTTLPFEYNDDDTRRFFSDLKDHSYGVNGVLTLPFELGKLKQIFKAGGSTLVRIRDFRSRIFQYAQASPAYFERSKAFLPYTEIFLEENIGPDGFRLNEFTNNQDKYFGVSILNGLFGMFDVKLGSLIRLVWGARVEGFQQFLTTRDVTSKRVIVNTEKWDLLPSLNLTLSPDTKTNIRLSGSRTVARTEFRELAPFSFYDYEVNYAVNGNPNLKRSSILNADLRYELYPRGGEAISVGIFYKNFKDPIELRLDPSSVLDRRNYGYSNAGRAYTMGLEAEFRKNLAFIGPGFTHFSLFSNLTYAYSKVSLLGSVSTTRPLQGQSPYLVNFGLQYNNVIGGWSGSLLYNRMGQRLALVGNLDFPDVYERPRDQLDLQVAKKLLKERGELKLTWAELLNPANYFYENVDGKKAFKEGVDRLFQSWKPGSTITIGFTYDLNLKK